MGSSPIFRIGQKRVRPNGLALFLTEAGADLNPGSRSPLRSAQSRGPPDLVRPIFRRLCLPARSVRSMWSTGPHSPHLPPAGTGLNPGSRSPLRSAQSRGPPDLVRPIFRRLCLPAWSVRSMWSTGPHSPHLPLAGTDLNPGSRSPLRSYIYY